MATPSSSPSSSRKATMDQPDPLENLRRSPDFMDSDHIDSEEDDDRMKEDEDEFLKESAPPSRSATGRSGFYGGEGGFSRAEGKSTMGYLADGRRKFMGKDRERDYGPSRRSERLGAGGSRGPPAGSGGAFVERGMDRMLDVGLPDLDFGDPFDDIQSASKTAVANSVAAPGVGTPASVHDPASPTPAS